MFNNKFQEIGKDIYVYENFLSKEECLEIVNFLKNVNENKWINSKIIGNAKFFYSKDEFSFIHKKLINIVPDGFVLGMEYPFTAVRLKKNDFWSAHRDVDDFDKIKNEQNVYNDEDQYEEKILSFYGVVVYFNDFEGGEIYYPNENVVYQGKAGDLVVHTSSCFHGVHPVKSEVRYSHSNFIGKKIRIPLQNVI